MAVSEKITFGCIPNRVSSDFNPSISSGADASASFVATNIQDYDLSVPWRCGYASSRHSWLQVAWSPTQRQFDLESVAFIGNLSPASHFRVRADSSSAPTALWERLPPTARESYSNATANDGVSAPDVTEVDEDCDTALSSPDGGTRLPAGASPSTVLYSFGTPATTCLTGYPVQEFRVVAKRRATGVTSGLTVALYEGGSPVSGASWEVLDADLDDTEYREFVFQWDAADLADSAGTNVEVYFSTVSAVGTVDILIEAVEWNQYPTGDGGADYDSGVTAAFDTFSSLTLGDASLSDGFVGVNWLLGHIFTSELTSVSHLLVEFWDRDLSTRRHDTYHASGYHDGNWDAIEIATLLAGPVYTPTYGMTRGWSVGVKDYAKVTRNRIGSTVYKTAFKKRKLSLTLRHVPHEEAMQNVFLWLGLEAGFSAPIVVFPEPTRTGVQTLQNGLYRLVSEPKAQNSAPGRSHITLDLEEW